MEVNAAKLARQEKGIALWRQAKGIGTLNWPTGFGKTFTACKLVLFRLLTKHPTASIRVVVPSDQLRQDWRTAVQEYLGDTQQVIVETVHYYQQAQCVHKCTLVIYDELHEYLSEDRRNLFGNWIQAQFRLGLTATYQDRHLRHELITEHLPIIDCITEQEALDNGWISKFLVFNLMLHLNEDEQKEYNKQSVIISEQIAKFKGGLSQAQACLNGGYAFSPPQWKDALWHARQLAAANGYTYELDQAFKNKTIPSHKWKEACEIQSLWRPDKVKGYAGALLKATKKRKDILFNSEQKVKLCVDIVKKLNKKFLVFSQSTSFADRVAGAILKEKIPTASYHSYVESMPLRMDESGEQSFVGKKDFVRYKTGKNRGKPKLVGKETLLKLAVKELRESKLKGLCTATALDKGFDDPTIQLGIIASFTGSNTQTKQRKGRTTRLDVFAQGVTVFIVNFVFITTVELNWLKEAQEAENSDYIYWIKSIDEISDNPEESVKTGFDVDFDI